MKCHIRLELRSGHAGVYSGSAHADTPEPEPVVNTSVASAVVEYALRYRALKGPLLRKLRQGY
ncbi:hypothetical protein C8Q76DRAFT_708734 [Earliella scabrosa]|nr:hypothetical protein C8Q76DRAFT_708734 [Earliella scabrosa]